MTHCLKEWPEYFEASQGECLKNFQVRKNDRDFKLGDILVIQEYNPESSTYTGKEIKRRVLYIMQGVFGLPEDVCVMGVCSIK